MDGIFAVLWQAGRAGRQCGGHTLVRWEWVGLGYCSYLLVVAFSGRYFERARTPVVAAFAIGWGMVALAAIDGGAVLWLHPVGQVVVPPLVLLGAYWLSGRFFVQPMPGVERWLERLDAAVLRRTGVLDWYRGTSRLVHEYMELSYLLVYGILPAGAAVLALGGHADALGPYWAAVFLAELGSYGVLPWIQTRPPRALEGEPLTSPEGCQAAFRRLNIAVLRRGSIQVNTLPSGHAAGAVAVALGVSASLPTVGVVFVLLSASIVLATVLGRYHYVVDSVLGALAGLGAWAFVSV